MRTVRRTIVGALVLALASLSTPTASGDDLVVVTHDGRVGGIATEAMNEWRGIPYATPPVGDLRWRPPTRVTPWSDVRDATAFRPPCLQPTSSAETGRIGTMGREDCLYLNVFSPPGATARSTVPVMVHLHPGGNYVGEPYRNPTAFVERDVVVVTVAYRLGIFGWGGHVKLLDEPGNHPGEYGLLDQIAALEWVEANIAAFGGDPHRVTLFGSSAGSLDTVALMLSPMAEGLIDRAAVQGEGFWPLTGAGFPIHYSFSTGQHAARLSGCNASADVIGCLRSVPARRLVRDEGFAGVPPLVGGAVLPEPPIDLLAAGAEVPMLVGFDREEERYNVLPFPLPDRYPRRTWLGDTTDLIGPELADEARALYPPSGYDSRAWAFVTMATDDIVGCPTRRLANAADGPTWRWLYTNVYEDLDGGDGRAAHIFEEPLLWHDPGMFGFGAAGLSFNPAEEVLSDRMTDYWTNFAKTGNPNGRGLPKWPMYETASEPTLRLDEEITVESAYHVEQCALLNTIEPFPG